jgi:hypothetical protein
MSRSCLSLKRSRGRDNHAFRYVAFASQHEAQSDLVMAHCDWAVASNDAFLLGSALSHSTNYSHSVQSMWAAA